MDYAVYVENVDTKRFNVGKDLIRIIQSVINNKIMTNFVNMADLVIGIDFKETKVIRKDETSRDIVIERKITKTSIITDMHMLVT